MIVLSIALDQFGPEILADLGEDAGQVADGEFGQGVPAVFSDKDQMSVKGIDDVPPFAHINVFGHVEPR